MPLHPLTNFEIPRYYQNEPKFNGAYSRDNQCNKLQDGAYVINLDDYADIGTHWITLYVSKNYVSYSGSFGVEHIPKQYIFIDNTNICNKFIQSTSI